MTGRYPAGSPVLTRYPLTPEQQAGDRSAWPWVPGTIIGQVAADEWNVVIEIPELEYSVLKARMDFGGMHHVHQPASPGPVHDGPVPWCCGSPGWLRPSGWQCSRCGISLDEREVS